MTRDKEPRRREEPDNHNLYLADLSSYQGRSGRIHGFRRIREAIGNINGITHVDPIILLDNAYAEYMNSGKDASPTIRSCAEEIWRRLDGERHHLIVRRLFPDLNGDAKNGERSGNVESVDDLVTEMGRFYRFFNANYTTNEVSPEIMVHRVVDAGNPPLHEVPFLPYPGGDVTPIGHHTYEIRATFGADESVKGFPTDNWVVKYTADGLIISQTAKGKKTSSRIPAPDDYITIAIPLEFQESQALNLRQVLSLAEAARSIEDKYEPYRLEFDGTRIDNQDLLSIIEAAPFTIAKNSYERLRPFGHEIVRPLTIITSNKDVENLPSDDLVVVHLPQRVFQESNQQLQLTRNLAFTAYARNTPLLVLAAGDIASQHVVRNLIDNKQPVLFTGEEDFADGERIVLYEKPSGEYDWERENPIVFNDQLEGRGISRIGGKAHGLHQLETHGFETSPYFVIETSVFRRVIDELGLRESLMQLDELSSANGIEQIAQITDPIIEKILGYDGDKIPDLENALTTIGGDSFAVRSSATCEDGPKSFAGIFDTKLNVNPQDIRLAILNVLASAVTSTSVQAMLAYGFKPSDISVGIIIQRMVDAQKAGTIFTKNHLTDDDSIVRVEATLGYGHQIVDGTAKQAQIVLVDKKTKKISGGDVFSRTGKILTEDEIDQLIDIGIDVEQSLDTGPLDIEWAMDQAGKIVLIQQRPL